MPRSLYLPRSTPPNEPCQYHRGLDYADTKKPHTALRDLRGGIARDPICHLVAHAVDKASRHLRDEAVSIGISEIGIHVQAQM
jgi:hypothetical protein